MVTGTGREHSWVRNEKKREREFAPNTFLQPHLPSLSILNPISGKNYCLTTISTLWTV